MKNLTFSVIGIAVLFSLGCATAGIPDNRAAADNSPSANKAAAGDKAKNVPYPDVPRISLEEAKADFDSGAAVFIDTHPAATYAADHVAGAINIPANQLAEHENKIPKGKKIIAYCS